MKKILSLFLALGLTASAQIAVKYNSANAISDPATALTIPSGFTLTGASGSTADFSAATVLFPSSAVPPPLATYVVQTSTNAPTNGQVLASLSTGLAKVTTTTGVISSVAAPAGTVVGTTDTQTMTNKTLTSPAIGTSILDTNSNTFFTLTATASAVNGVTFANAATGNNATFTASGSDSNIGLSFATKGTGNFVFSSTGSGGHGIQINETTGNPLIQFLISSSSKAAFGVANSSGDIITGSVNGDTALATGGNILLSSDGGSTIGVKVVTSTGALQGKSSILSTGAAGGIGYATGAGGAVTQGTSRTTGVTLNTTTGAITLVSAAGSTTPATFTVTDSSVAALDVPVVVQTSGTDAYEIFVTHVAAGSFNVTCFTTGGTTTETPVLHFVIIKGVSS